LVISARIDAITNQTGPASVSFGQHAFGAVRSSIIDASEVRRTKNGDAFFDMNGSHRKPSEAHPKNNDGGRNS
jgi:hypothetical protein